MIEEAAGLTLRGGALLALGALAGAFFPTQTRQVARRAMVLGMRATDWARTTGAEAMEKGLDVMAEARMEHEQMVRAAEREADRRRLRVVRDGDGTRSTARRRPPAGRATARARAATRARSTVAPAPQPES